MLLQNNHHMLRDIERVFRFLRYSCSISTFYYYPDFTAVRLGVL